MAPTMRPFLPKAAAKRRSLTEPWVMTISSPKECTPQPLMLTPNWPDQNCGSGRCGRRSGSRLTMLCAAALAPRTALSPCSIDMNWYS